MVRDVYFDLRCLTVCHGARCLPLCPLLFETFVEVRDVYYCVSRFETFVTHINVDPVPVGWFPVRTNKVCDRDSCGWTIVTEIVRGRGRVREVTKFRGK